MDQSRLKEYLMEWIKMHDPVESKMDHLSEALYSFKENNLFPDDVSVSPEQAIVCWKIVQRIRLEGKFPEELRM